MDSQESANSRQGKVSTFIPERTRVAPRRGHSKRKTTIREFTFVKDWMTKVPSSLGQTVPDNTDDVSTPSSVCSTPERSKLRRGSVSNTGPLTRSHRGGAGGAGEDHEQPETANTSEAPQPSMNSLPSSSRSSKASHLTLSVVPSAASTPIQHDITSQSQGSAILTTAEMSSTVPGEMVEAGRTGSSVDSMETANPVSDSHMVARDGPDTAAVEPTPRSPTGQSRGAASELRLDLSSAGTPTVGVDVDHTRCATPGEKSMTIISKTPRSGPASRHNKARRRKLTEPPEGSKQAPINAPGAKKAKVQLWGPHLRRSATDITDIDLVLTTLEEVTMEYIQQLSSSPPKKALTKFFHLMKKQFIDQLDLSRECRILNSAHRRMTGLIRKQRKKLLALQQENVRLTNVIRERNIALNEKDTGQGMQELTTFLYDLQRLHQDGTAGP